MICATVEAILAQRLVRRVCTKCREEAKVSSSMLLDLGMKKEDIQGKKFFKGTGCDDCNNTGYKGRIALFELMMMNDTIRDMVMGNASTDELREEACKLAWCRCDEFGIGHGRRWNHHPRRSHPRNSGGIECDSQKPVAREVQKLRAQRLKS